MMQGKVTYNAVELNFAKQVNEIIQEAEIHNSRLNFEFLDIFEESQKLKIAKEKTDNIES